MVANLFVARQPEIDTVKLVYLLLHGLAYFLRLWPDALLRTLCTVLGNTFFYLSGNRRKHLLSQLAHAYPDKNDRELHYLARTNCARTIEMGLFAVVYPTVRGDWARARLQVDDEILMQYRQLVAAGPVLVLVPHVCLMEMMTLGREVGFPTEETAVLYRPFKSAGLERFVHEGRARFGLKPLARKKGLIEAAHLLGRGGKVVMLFDQSAGPAGEMLPFLGRLASTTTLPDMLGKRFGASVVLLWIERTAFWRGRFRMELLGRTPQLVSPVTAANARLEQLILNDPAFATDWLWLHRRWKESLRADKLFTGDAGWPALADAPGASRCVVRLPEQPEELADVMPLLQKLRQSRPDFQVTLLGPAAVLDALPDDCSLSERRVTLPAGPARRKVLLQEAKRYPAVGVMFRAEASWAREMKKMRILTVAVCHS